MLSFRGSGKGRHGVIEMVGFAGQVANHLEGVVPSRRAAYPVVNNAHPKDHEEAKQKSSQSFFAEIGRADPNHREDGAEECGGDEEEDHAALRLNFDLVSHC